MADIEKVVKGLEYCVSFPCKLCSSDCPYFENEACCIDEMQKDALELLKEQELCDRCGRVRLKSKWEGR